MSRYTIPSFVTAAVVLGLAVVAFLLGKGLLPTKIEATEKGTLMPWALVWGMVGIAALCAVLLAGFLVIKGVQGLSGDDPHA